MALIILWTLLYPLIAAFVLPLPFGIRKGLDKAILLFLNNVTSAVVLLFYVILAEILDTVLSSVPAREIVILLLPIILKTVFDGLVWHFFLIDRKLNGFLISFICAAIFMTPYYLAYFLG